MEGFLGREPAVAGRVDELVEAIYGYHMSTPQKTTVYLDAEAYRRVKVLAAEDGRPPAALIREAVSQYASRRLPRRRARSVGIGRSGRKDLSVRAEKLLSGFGRSR